MRKQLKIIAMSVLSLVAGVVIGCAGLFCGLQVYRFCTDDNEISDREYLDVENSVIADPELAPLVDQAMCDGKISNLEYRQFERVRRAALQKRLADAGAKFRKKKLAEQADNE